MGLWVPMLANACTGLSAKWFGVDERNLPTALGSIIPGGRRWVNLFAARSRNCRPKLLLIAIMVTVAAGMFVMIFQVSFAS